MSPVYRKLFRFFLTAGTAAVVDVGGFAGLCFLRVPIAVAAVGSFGLAAVVNYLLSARFAFGRAATLLAAVGGLIVNVSVTLLASSYLGIAPVLAKILGVGTAFLVNFWLNNHIVFHKRSLQQNQ